MKGNNLHNYRGPPFKEPPLDSLCIAGQYNRSNANEAQHRCRKLLRQAVGVLFVDVPKKH